MWIRQRIGLVGNSKESTIIDIKMTGTKTNTDKISNTENMYLHTQQKGCDYYMV